MVGKQVEFERLSFSGVVCKKADSVRPESHATLRRKTFVGLPIRFPESFIYLFRGSRMTATSFTKEQSQLVIESWQLLKKDSSTHSLLFFTKIFEIAPGAKALFSFLKDSPDAPLDKNLKLKAHALNVFRLTGDSASMLGEKGAIEALHPKLKELGRRHVGYGVIAAHFEVVKTALLVTIESLLLEDWSAEKKEATKAPGLKPSTSLLL